MLPLHLLLYVAETIAIAVEIDNDAAATAYTMTAESAAVAITPSDASLEHHRRIAAESAALAITPADAALAVTVHLLAESMSVEITPTDAFFSLVGQNTNTVVWGKTQPIKGSYALDPNQIDVQGNEPSHKLAEGDYFIRITDSSGAIVAYMVYASYYAYIVIVGLLLLMGPRHPPTADDRVPLMAEFNYG